MSKDSSGNTRQQRLAAKLRENLKRRKAQDRARSDAGSPDKSVPPARKPPESTDK